MEPKPNTVVRFAVERRITMGMAILGVVVIGWLSLYRLPLEFLPTFSSSNISVRTTYASSSPEEVQRLVVQPLEDILGTINGIESLSSSASANSGTVNVRFVDGTNMDLAAVEVRDRVDRVRSLLPDDLDRIYIRRFQSTDIPVLRIRLSAPWDRDRLYHFVEDIMQRRLERLEGVAEVSVNGIYTREIQVNLDSDRLASLGVDVRGLVARLRNNNVTASGGAIRDGSRKLLIRVMGEYESLEQIRDLPVNTAGLRLRDVATVAYAYPLKEDFDYLNGAEALSINIYKSSTANLLAMSDRVREEVDAMRKSPEAEGLGVHYYFDSSEDVRKGLKELRNTGVLGGLLAVLFMFLLLRRVRTTLLIAIAIPISVVLTFVIMYLSRQAGVFDLTLNIMTLMGLMLAIGMLVDNSIVVIESIFRHRQELGESSRTAALAGASEVALPIVASTLTTICVFVPLVFLRSGAGRFARYMENIGSTVCIVIVASLLVSLTVVPMVAAFLLKGESRKPQPLFDKTVGGYGRFLKFTLRHRLALILAILVMLFGSWHLYSRAERTFGSHSFERRVNLLVDVPSHYTIEQTEQLYGEVYTILDEHRKELDIKDISYRFRRGGGRSRGHYGTNRFEIFLKDEEESAVKTADARDRIEKLLPSKAGVTFTMGRSMRDHSGSSSSFQVDLVGDKLPILEVMSRQVVDQLKKMPQLRDVDSSLESGAEEIHVGVNRERALQAGLSSEAVARSISSALTSRAASTFKTEDREVDLIMQYREEDRRTLAQLKKMPIMVDDAPLPIGTFAGFEFEPGPRTIQREDRRSTVEINADTQKDVPSFAIMGPVSSILNSMDFPAGYEWQMSRRMWEGRQEASSALFALLFAMLLIYLIMASLFESFAQPFTIMFAVPFAFIGVGLIMWLTDQPQSNSTDMGLIILAGIVVNNAIVLIHHINTLRSGGMSRNEAIVLGGQHRLRPIILTAATTILGLSPMVAPFFLPQYFGAAQGRAAYWAPVGLVILGGLFTSTFLTLVVIPTIYSLVDDVIGFLKRMVAAV